VIRRWLTDVALPLAIGASTYLLFRPGPPLVAWMRGAVGLEHPLAVTGVLDLLQGALPDAAWSYALIATVRLVWRSGPASARNAWTFGAIGLASGWELAQRFTLVPGTFSMADLLASVIAGGLAALAVRGTNATAAASGASLDLALPDSPNQITHADNHQERPIHAICPNEP
jgi:hypothetical protein